MAMNVNKALLVDEVLSYNEVLDVIQHVVITAREPMHLFNLKK